MNGTRYLVPSILVNGSRLFYLVHGPVTALARWARRILHCSFCPHLHRRSRAVVYFGLNFRCHLEFKSLLFGLSKCAEHRPAMLVSFSEVLGKVFPCLGGKWLGNGEIGRKVRSDVDRRQCQVEGQDFSRPSTKLLLELRFFGAPNQSLCIENG